MLTLHKKHARNRRWCFANSAENLFHNGREKIFNIFFFCLFIIIAHWLLVQPLWNQQFKAGLLCLLSVVIRLLISHLILWVIFDGIFFFSQNHWHLLLNHVQFKVVCVFLCLFVCSFYWSSWTSISCSLLKHSFAIINPHIKNKDFFLTIGLKNTCIQNNFNP